MLLQFQSGEGERENKKWCISLHFIQLILICIYHWICVCSKIPQISIQFNYKMIAKRNKRFFFQLKPPPVAHWNATFYRNEYEIAFIRGKFQALFLKKKLNQSHLCLYVKMYIHENENTIFAIYAHSITRIYNQFIYVKWVCHQNLHKGVDFISTKHMTEAILICISKFINGLFLGSVRLPFN